MQTSETCCGGSCSEPSYGKLGINIDNVSLKTAGKMLASLMGALLEQSYRLHKDKWYLFTKNEPIRPLTTEEIAWHTARNHAPFVQNGITSDNPDWWKDPDEQ